LDEWSQLIPDLGEVWALDQPTDSSGAPGSRAQHGCTGSGSLDHDVGAFGEGSPRLDYQEFPGRREPELGTDLKLRLEKRQRVAFPEGDENGVVGQARLQKAAGPPSLDLAGQSRQHPQGLFRRPKMGSKDEPVGIYRHCQIETGLTRQVGFAAHLNRDVGGSLSDHAAEAAPQLLGDPTNTGPKGHEAIVAAADAWAQPGPAPRADR